MTVSDSPDPVADSRPEIGPEVFERLQGEWTFVREVPGKATMSGRARIAPTERDRARYDETARVILADGKTLTGGQSYHYRRLPSPANGFDVLFAENEELFERLDFHASADGTLRADAEHHCPPDHYVSRFTLDREDQLVVEHKVRGPRKDYVVRTFYRRVGRAASPRRNPSRRQHIASGWRSGVQESPHPPFPASKYAGDPMSQTPARDNKASSQQPQTSVHPVEPEDPKATGTSESQKRALDLNVGGSGSGQAGEPGHQSEEHPDSPAGQHATGSFTDKKSSKTT